MRFFYVDYENVKDAGLNGIAKLTGNDIVKIFYSEDAQRMSFGTHRRIIESKAVFTYQKISPEMKTIPNALDLMLIQDLNTIMKSDKSSEYYIISQDNDFNAFIEEKLKKKYKIKRLTQVCDASSITNNSATSANESINGSKKEELENARRKKEQTVRSLIGKNLKKYNEYKEYIVNAVMEAVTRQQVNNSLQQRFFNEDVKEILEGLQPLLKDMPGK